MGMSADLEAAVAAGSTMVRHRACPVRRATAQGPPVVPPTLSTRHYAVPEQEKVWHPRS